MSRADLPKAMKAARTLAKRGGCSGFEHVRSVMSMSDENAALTLRLYATARDRDEIDRLCSEARAEL